jgi:hypothetical protein
VVIQGVLSKLQHDAIVQVIQLPDAVDEEVG